MSTTPPPEMETPQSEISAIKFEAPSAPMGQDHEKSPPGRAPDVRAAPSAAFSTKAALYGVTTLIIFANFVQCVVNFTSTMASFHLSEVFGRPASSGESNWMAAGYGLTQSSVVMISGRLGDVFGHQRVLFTGAVILTVFSLANAFATSFAMFVAMRAVTGLGGGLIMPNAVAMITVMIPPGRLRNVCLGFFGASFPIGGWTGALLMGLFAEGPGWKWLFIFTAAIATVVYGTLFFVLPKDEPEDKDGKIDYFGAFLGLGSLLLFNFVFQQAPSAGWDAPEVIAGLVASAVMFVSFLYWEHKVAKEPILPLSIFKGPTFGALILVVLVTYMSYGISQWNMIVWQIIYRDWTIVQVAIGWIPFAIGAAGGVFLAAWLVPRMPAQWLMAIGVASSALANLLLAPMPIQQTYWAQTFLSVFIGALCPDFVFVAAQIIASNSVKRSQQGVAGSLVGMLNAYGITLGLGFSGTIDVQVSKSEAARRDPVLGMRAALYFGFALAILALVLDFAFVRMPKEKKEGWEEGGSGEDSPPAQTGAGNVVADRGGSAV